MKRRAVLFATSTAIALGASAGLRPTRKASESLQRIDLDQQVPKTFSDWTLDESRTPILPNPETQAKLDAIYTQVFAQTYINQQGFRVMLSIAYGEDQGSAATAVHRPEFCYVSQGFSIRSLGEADLTIDGRTVKARKLVARLDNRIEPIIYWVTLNDKTLLPGIERKVQQIRYGLTGNIPDGMLIRASCIDSNLTSGFELQSRFLDALFSAMDPKVRSRYIGTVT